MTLIEDVLATVATWVGANGLPIATIASVLVVVFYGRRGLRIGGTLAGWIRTIFVVVLAIAALAVAGVVTIHVGPIVEGVRWVLTQLVDVLAGLSLQAAPTNPPAGPPEFVVELLAGLQDLVGEVVSGPREILGSAIDAVTSAGA